MKKFWQIFVTLLASFCVLMGLTACNKKVDFHVDFIVDNAVYATIETNGEEMLKMPNDPEKEGATFEGWYWDKDTWKKPFTASSLLDAPLSSNMSVYAKWATVESLQGTAASFAGFEKQSNYAYSIVLPNATTAFTLQGIVSTHAKSSWTLCTDIFATQVIPSKTAVLEEGDNIYYVLVTAESGETQLYTLTIRRKPIYTVTFDTNGGTSVDDQRIEEGDQAIQPSAIQRVGYDFVSWTHDFTTPITRDVVISANWQARQYTVQFAGEGADELENIRVTYDAAYAQLPYLDKEGYTFGWYTAQEGGTLITNETIVEITDTQTLYSRWTINQYAIVVEQNLLEAGAITNGGTHSVDYQTSFLAEATSNLAYEWLGWYDGEELISTDLSFSFAAPAKDVRITATWKLTEGLEAFDFTTTPTDCTLVGVKDKTATEYVVPNCVTNIREGIFSGCSNVESLTLPFVGESRKTETDLYQYPLGYIFGASDYTDSTATLQAYYGDTLDKSTSVTYYIPNSLRTVSVFEGIIPAGAFSNCSGLTNIALPVDCTFIGTVAFFGCSGLKKITVPDSVTTIEEAAFYGCSGLTSMTLSFVGEKKDGTGDTHFDYIFGSNVDYLPTSLKTVVITGGVIGNGAFSGCSGLTSITLPDGVTSIGNYAFSGCSSLASITLPNSVTSIGEYAFQNCEKLKSITIPDGVTFIYRYAFYNCRGLTSITIPDGVSSIGYYAFSGCSGLTSITIPDSVTSIGQYAFSGCSKLTSLYITDIAAWCKIGFDDIYSNPLYFAENLYYNGKLVTELTIPESVTSIGEYAFSNYSSLTDIAIPDTVKYIRAYAFYNCSEATITIDGSIASIGDYAFSNCSGLTSVTIANDSNTSIGQYAFSNCSGLTSVIIIENNSISIGNYAFNNCTALAGITLPDSVTSIGDYAFYGCSGLTSASIGRASIGQYAFSNCSKLANVTIGDKVTTIGQYAFQKCSALTSITVPDSVTSIGSSAFSGCGGLTSITLPFVGEKKNGTENIRFAYIFGGSYSNIPTSLKKVVITGGVSIGDYAFYDCSGLTDVTIPNSVTSIGNYAFSGCSSLTNITLPFVGRGSGGSKYFYGIFGSNVSALPTSLTTVVITGGSSIASSAFSGCSSLTSITIPDTVTSIGEYAFSSCSGLTSITIPDGVTSIGDCAFSGCSGLTSVTIPDTVTSIGEYAFSNCSGLTSITIPDSVTSIEQYAFENCTALTSITIDEDNAIYNSEENCIIEKSSKTLILGCTGSIIPTDGSVTSIGARAFYNCSGLTSITIPGSVTSIGERAFYNCSGLTSITIPDSVTSIGYCAFEDCSNLTSITIPDSVTSMGDYAFGGCSSLTSITLPFVGEKKDGTGDTDFYYIFGSRVYNIPTSLTTVVITGGSSIRARAFYNCSELTSITIPDSVNSIGEKAFCGCSSLTSITIPDGVTSIGNYAFDGCSSLTSITIPDNVTSIGNYAFSGCSGLTSITIPDGVTSIEGYAFYGCSNLTNITIPDSVTSIEGYAFYGCSSLTSITIPDSVTSIGQSAFSGCSGLTSITLPFVGEKKDGTGATYFGYIFGASSYDKNTDYVPTSLTTVVITGGSSIASSAFSDCSGLACVTIRNGVTSIGYGAFADCSDLTSVTIPNSVTSIGQSAFSGCSSLTSVNIGNGVTWIGPYAFSNCSDLTSITIPDSVTYIGYSAFYRCSGLKSVTFENPNGWFVSTSSAATSGTNLTLTNTSTNATYLTSTYQSYYWKRNG